MTQRNLATHWPELLASLQPRVAFAPLAHFVNVVQSKGPPDHAGSISPMLQNAADALVCGAIVDPGHFAQTAAGKLVPFARRVFVDSDGFVDRVAPNLGALSLADLAEAAGWDLELAGDAPLERLLAREPARPDVARQVAWAALARGRAAELEPFILKDPMAQQPDPDAAFKGGAQPIQVHLARCMVHGGDPGAAWQVYRDQVPVNFAIEQASWSELLWAGRAVHVVLGGAAPSSLLGWLRSEVGAA